MTDLAIIGGGPAGYTAAEKAAKAGLSVILFEKKSLGGVCLNEGCIPTKTLLYSAKLYDQARHSEKYGIATEGTAFDYTAILKRKTKVLRKLGGGIKVRLRDAGVTVIEGEAGIIGRNSGDGNLGNDGTGSIVIECNQETFEAKNLLICTGSSAFVPPIPGIENCKIITSTEALELQEIPNRITIIGGGVIGMEFASLFNSFGSKVTVIEMLPEILGGLDSEISAMLRGIYTKKGIEFHLGCKVIGITGNGNGSSNGTGNGSDSGFGNGYGESGETVFRVICLTPDGEQLISESEQVLISAGRRANVKGIGLETIGVECGRGIKVDSRQRTNVPGVYAAGDVTGFSMLAHTASREAEVAVDNIIGKNCEMRYDAIPGVVYTNPEVAGVGMTEAAAASEGKEIKVAKLPMQYSGRFVAENEAGEGICKIIAESGSGRLLGVHMMGNPCSEILGAACIAIERGMTAEDFAKTILPHPSVCEILKEAANALI